ncbi:MAG TPA: CPBP family intramembrane glutamic endopeptidase [Actinocatenispora sp.]
MAADASRNATSCHPTSVRIAPAFCARVTSVRIRRRRAVIDASRSSPQAPPSASVMPQLSARSATYRSAKVRKPRHGSVSASASSATAVALVALLARRLGWGRAALTLRLGDPRATTGLRVAGRPVRWTVAGPLAVAAVLALFAFLPPAPPPDRLPHVLGWLPVFLLGALVNAAAEEFLYRHATTAALRGVTATVPAVLLGSVVFGLGHLTGNPGGVVGVGYTAVFGLVCAAAMVRVRGVAWNLPVHVAGDLGVVLTAALLAT